VPNQGHIPLAGRANLAASLLQREVQGVERRIEDSLERGGNPEHVLLMEVRGDVDHAEPNPGKLLVDPGAVDMLFDGADVDAGALGDGCQGISSLCRLEPLRLFLRGYSTSGCVFIICWVLLISAHVILPLLRMTSVARILILV
jgi:hypothetical protein